MKPGIDYSVNFLIVFVYIGGLVNWVFVQKLKGALREQLVEKYDFRNAVVGFCTLLFLIMGAIFLFFIYKG